MLTAVTGRQATDRSDVSRLEPMVCRPTSVDTVSRKTLVIGLGNPLVSDDSVGLRVADCLRPLLADQPDVEVVEDYWGGLRLMEQMIGYDRAIVIDAICTGAGPGKIHHLSLNSIATQKSASAHDVNLPTALAFGRRAGVDLPTDENVQLVGVEAEDVLTFGDQCTPAVAAAIPHAVQEVIRLLKTPPGGPPK